MELSVLFIEVKCFFSLCPCLKKQMSKCDLVKESEVKYPVCWKVQNWVWVKLRIVEFDPVD